MTPANAAAEKPGRRDRLRWSLAIFAVALLVRALHLWQLEGSLLLEVLMGDARTYDAWAREIAGGDWLGSEVFYQAPLYPYFLALVYATLGGEPLAARIVQCALGAASCVLLARAGWNLVSRTAGIAAGLLLALYAPAIFADTTIQKSSLVLFLVCALLLAVSRIAPKPGPGRCAALGAVLAALVLARENALVFVPVLALWLAWQTQAAGLRRLVPVALFLVGLTAVLLPVALRNLSVGGELHLTTSQFGPNFFIGNRAGADGTYAPLVPGRGDARYERLDATALAEQAVGRPLGPSEVSRFFTEAAVRDIRSDPGAWLRLLARKLALAVNAVEVADTEDLYTHQDASPLLALLGLVFHFGVLVPLALLGVFIQWRDPRPLLPVAVLLAAYTASLLVFYVFGRYRLPLVPPLALFAGAGLAGLQGLRAAGPTPRALLAGALAVAAVVCHWPLVERDYLRSLTSYNLGNQLAALEREAEAATAYQEALRLHADNALAANNLGVMRARAGDLAGARRHYEQALRSYPGYVDARFNLARTLHEGGDTQAAIASYLAGLSLAPRRAEAHAELGELYRLVGQPELAAQSFRRARELDPETPIPRRGGEAPESGKSVRPGT